MLVYRVETLTGRGIYRSVYYTGDCQTGIDHPAPHKDGLPEEFSWKYQFGFRSLAQLNAWFRKDVRDDWKTWENDNEKAGRPLKEENKIYVAVYDVPLSEVMFGGRQMIFIKEAAKLISRKIINTFDDALLVA